MRRLCGKIFGHTHRQQGATLHEAPAAKGQTREAISYFCRNFLSYQQIGKNAVKLDLLASISIHPVFIVSLLKKYYGDRLLHNAVQVEDDAEYEIDSILYHGGCLCH